MPVFDQGYQHWDGPLSSHAWRWLTITRQGVVIALQNKFLRFLTMLGFFPAILLGSVLVLWGLLEQNADFVKPILRAFRFTDEMMRDPARYRVMAWTLAFHFFFQYQLAISMLLVLVAGPSLISQDLRFNAIPLYFSRPLNRSDYLLGKLGVIAFFLLLVTALPALAGYLLGVLFSLNLDVLRDTWHLVPCSIAYSLVIVLSAGTLMLALSSLSSSSRNVAASWIAVCLISSSVASILGVIHTESSVRQARGDRQALWQSFLDDWRPVLSYTANLDRVGRALFGVDAVAKDFAEKLLPPMAPKENRVQVQFRLSGAQFPWQWSALVLLVLFGVSLWLLTTRVRTLDRL